MKGKIFSESANIYQDQAKILFDYYQSVAEKIVKEEMRLEEEKAKLEAEKRSIEELLASKVLFIIPYTLVLWFQGKLKSTREQVVQLTNRINEFQKLHNEIFRDYKVTKLGVAYVPVADQVKYENNSFIVDYTGMVNDSEVKLQLPKQNDLLIETISKLESLSAEAPIVETSNDIEEIETEQYSTSIQHLNQHDYLGSLERSLRTISFCMDDLDVTSVHLPLVSNNSDYLTYLKEHAINELPTNAAVFNVFDNHKYDDQISKFQELNKLKDSLSRHTRQFEDVLKELMVTMANSVQAISSLKLASTDKIVMESNKILFKILKSPYNHYSPVLEQSEIDRIKNENFNYSEAVMDYVPFQLKDSSKLKYNLFEGTWKAEDGSATNFPFGIHQIHEEIVAPIVQNLMNETRIERLKIYNHIKDQKISYLNKWHQDTEDFYGRNRAESADLINLMRASLRDYIAAFNTLASLKKTEESMNNSNGRLDSTVVTNDNSQAEVMAAFELQSKEFQNVQMDFENFMEQLKEDIDVKATEFEHIEYYEASLRDTNPHETAVAADEVQELDMRRKPLIAVNPLFAKSSELPPVPSIEELTHEHMALDLPEIAKNTLNELENDMLEASIQTEESTSSSELEDESEAEENSDWDESVDFMGSDDTSVEDEESASSEEEENYDSDSDESYDSDLAEDADDEAEADHDSEEDEDSFEDDSDDNSDDDNDSNDEGSEEDDSDDNSDEDEDDNSDDDDSDDDDSDDDDSDDDDSDDDGGDDDGGDDDGGGSNDGGNAEKSDSNEGLSNLFGKAKDLGGGLKGKFGF
jgi:hypothetical protein